MEGSGTTPYVIAAKVNVPPSLSTITLFIDNVTGQLHAKKEDGTVLSAAAGGAPVLFT